MLALVLLAGGANPAYAAGVIPEVVIRPDRNPQVVCVGQKVEILARFMVFALGPDVGWLQPIGPIPVDPKVAVGDPRIVSVTHKDQPTNYGVAEPYQGERFDLSGLKAGTTTITFSKTVGPEWRGDTKNSLNPFHNAPARPLVWSKKIDVKVKRCELAVNAVHIITIPGGNLVTAVSEPIRVTADENGELSGQGSMEWAVAVAPNRNCSSITSSITPASDVSIDGVVDDAGQLALNLEHESVTWSYHSRCTGTTFSADFDIPLELPPNSLAMSSEGGSVEMSQKFWLGTSEAPIVEIDDKEIITVAPIEESDAVSLVPR